MNLLLLALPAVIGVQDPKSVSLFDGKSLAGWTIDAPALDQNPEGPKPFVARDGKLVSVGTPTGHLITETVYENYRLDVEYRFTKQAGNCGVLVHSSTLRAFANVLPKSLEVQMMSGDAGDFYQTGETIRQKGAAASSGIRLKNFTDGSEKPIGEWNVMRIECLGDTVKVWVNGNFVNEGEGCSVTKGKIALQSEGVEVEFRKLELTRIRAIAHPESGQRVTDSGVRVCR